MSTPRTGAAHVLTGNVARLVIGGAGTIVIAALIGPADKGVLATLTAVSAIAATVIGVGMGGALSYYVATKTWPLAQSNAVTLGFTVMAAVVAYFGFEILRELGSGEVLSGLSNLQLAVATAVVLLLTLAGQSLLALKRFKLFARLVFLSALANPALFLVFRAAGLANVTSACWAWIGAQAVVAIPAQLVLMNGGNWRLSPPTDFRGAMWYGVRYVGSDLLGLVNLRLDVLLLRAFSTSAATGAYALVTQMTEVIWVVPTSIGVAVFPEVAEGGHERGVWTARVSRLSSALAVVLALACGVAGTLLIALVMPQYLPGVPALWLLLPGTVAACTGKVLANDLRARRLPQALLASTALSVVITVAGDVLLVPALGASGAAIVSSIAYTVNALVLVWYFTSTTQSQATSVLPRSSDLVEAVRLTRRTASEFLRRRRTDASHAAAD